MSNTLRCEICGARLPEGVERCPKCGDPQPLPVQPSDLRPEVKFMYVTPLYSKPNLRFDAEGTLVSADVEFRLFKAIVEQGAPPFILYDADGYVNPRRFQYSLAKLDPDLAARLEGISPSIFKEVVRRISAEANLGDESPVQILLQAGLLVTPVPRLRRVEFLERFDWRKHIGEIVNYKGKPLDPRLREVRLCTLCRGFKQALNPHTILVLPAQTGKSEWYKYVGVCDDKASANGLIGYADADGPKPGSLDGAELPFAIDQIESGMPTIFRYLLSLMEIGEARVDLAGYPFNIQCLSPLIIISNPLGDPKSYFALLLDRMSRNPALGRRFGIILYDEKAGKLPERERDLSAIMEKVALFRAVEEYALPEIHRILNDERVWSWLNTRNEEFTRQALKLIEPLNSENESLYLFLREFVENGVSHTRGGALRAAIAQNLDRIALKNYDLNELITEAEEHLHELLTINYTSLEKIMKSTIQLKEETVLRIFDTLPIYLREIISAVELWRRGLSDESRGQLTVPLKLYLNTFDYTPQSTRYFSEVLKDAKKGNPERHNDNLRSHFGFEIGRDPAGIYVTIFGLTPIPSLKVLGNLGSLGNLERFSGEEKESEPLDQGSGESVKRVLRSPGEVFQNSQTSQNSQGSEEASFTFEDAVLRILRETDGEAGDLYLLNELKRLKLFEGTVEELRRRLASAFQGKIILTTETVKLLKEETRKPPSLTVGLGQLVQARDELERRIGQSPLLEELAGELGWNLEDAERVLRNAERDRQVWRSFDGRVHRV